ncbi:hypothetical protein FB45DRAFT_1054427, partial [Roridomyces roridus]
HPPTHPLALQSTPHQTYQRCSLPPRHPSPRPTVAAPAVAAVLPARASPASASAKRCRPTNKSCTITSECTLLALNRITCPDSC